jgi:hypothetical protein
LRRGVLWARSPSVRAGPSIADGVAKLKAFDEFNEDEIGPIGDALRKALLNGALADMTRIQP